jgi:DNA-binding NtrC family response regulator
MSAATPAIARNRGAKVLIASPRAEFRKRILSNLSSETSHAEEAGGGADALIRLEEADYATLLLDRQIQDLDVEEVLATIRARHPQVNVVLVDPETKPEQLSLDLSGVAPDAAPSEEPAGAPGSRNGSLPGMIGTSRKMQQIYRLARLVAPRDTAVLIVGATGTGKELIARGIHGLSQRSRGPFVVVNCAAIPESLLEAELFGFTRGAFTGAFQARLGRIHSAHGGTLLLDEVGELPLSMQAKILRFVQEGEVQRLGSSDIFRVDARLIASTNVNLLERVREKQFREDLYYRLAVFPLELPPLHKRVEDIFPLAEHFMGILCRQSGVPQKMFSLEAAHVLLKHRWPGNVRELQHAVERAFVLADGNEEIRGEDLAMPPDAA